MTRTYIRTLKQEAAVMYMMLSGLVQRKWELCPRTRVSRVFWFNRSRPADEGQLQWHMHENGPRYEIKLHLLYLWEELARNALLSTKYSGIYYHGPFDTGRHRQVARIDK
jgi:hypothetical protein